MDNNLNIHDSSLAGEILSDECDLAQERDEWKNKYLYALAEISNLKARFAKEAEYLKWTSRVYSLKNMLEVADAFELAVENNSMLADSTSFGKVSGSLVRGFELIFEKFNSALKASGCEKMPICGEDGTPVDFNTDFHKAVATLRVDDEKLDGKVVDVRQNGYMLNGNLIIRNSPQ